MISLKGDAIAFRDPIGGAIGLINAQGLNIDNPATHPIDSLHFLVHPTVGHWDKHTATATDWVVRLVSLAVLMQTYDFV